MKFRRRLRSEVAVLGGERWRVTRRGKKIVGIERWIGPTAEGGYGYMVWKGE